MIDPVWLALIAMVGTSAAATTAGILTLIKANAILATSNQTLARAGDELANARQVAEALLKAARLRAAELLEADRIRAGALLKAARLREQAAPPGPSGPLMCENTAALCENTESVRANTLAVEQSGPD